MSEKSETSLSPLNIREVGNTFRMVGWASFGLQLALIIISSVVLFLFIAFGQKSTGSNTNAGAGSGVFFTICGLVALGVGIYLTFRYKNIGRKLLSSNSDNRPRKSQTVQVLRLGLTVNLVGMLLTLLGVQAIAGGLAIKAISSQTSASGLVVDPNRIISGLEMFVVLASVQVMTGHFVGVVGSIWLLNRITR
ncbi:MAG: DUF3611 family protein [Cyanobacteria bacterium P01_A01_bin.84]